MKKAMNTVLGIFGGFIGVVVLFYLVVLVTAWI